MLKFKEFTEWLNEADLGSSVTRLQNALTIVNNVDDTSKLHIKTKIDDTTEYIERFEEISDIRKVFVETKGFSDADFEKIKNIIQKDSTESLTALVDYLKSPYDISYFTSVDKTTDLPKKMSKDTKISENILKAIFSMEGNMKSGKGVGKGELFLGLFVNSAANSAQGDVNVGGKKYEVKAKSARLNTQNGFGQGESAMITFLNSISSISPTLSDKYSKLKVQTYNLNQRGSSFYDLFIDAAKEKCLDQIFDLMANNLFCGPIGIWKNGDAKLKLEIIKTLRKNVKPNGSCDSDGLNYGLMNINIQYYRAIEWFEGIFLIDPTNGNFAFFNPDDKKMGEKWLSINTKYTQPSWQDAPTSNCWKISLK